MMASATVEDEPPPICYEQTAIQRPLHEMERSEHKYVPPPVKTYAKIPASSITQLITSKANKYGVDPALMIRIAKAESGLNPNAKNKNSSASGLFQFISSTWAGTPEGRAGKSPFDADANAEAAARKISQGGISAWNASRSKWQ